MGPVKLNVLPSDSVEYDDEDDNSTAQIQVRTCEHDDKALSIGSTL